MRTVVPFYTNASPNTPAIDGVLVYIGSPNRLQNQYYLGPAPLRNMANQIARARGLAGPNYDYLFQLEPGGVTCGSFMFWIILQSMA
jgi:cation transport regulator ChaC